MSTHKDEKNGTWYVMVRYHDWKGEKKQKCKRGFATKRDAQEWERTFLLKEAGDLDMTFEALVYRGTGINGTGGELYDQKNLHSTYRLLYSAVAHCLSSTSQSKGGRFQVR